MRLIAHIQESVINLFSAKLRSLLALLGILVGTASVVAMVSGGELATNEALKQFKILGTDLLAASVANAGDQQASPEKKAELSVQDALALTSVSSDVLRVAPYSQLYNTMNYEGHDLNGAILGVTGEFANIVHLDLEQGRFVSLLDGYQLYCVIGHGVFEQLTQLSWGSPIGHQIKVGKNYFTIIGIAKPWQENSFVYASIDNAIMIPVQSAVLLNQHATITNILFQLSSHANIDSVKTRLEETLLQMLPGKAVYFRSAKELIERMKKQSDILTILLGLIGGISLLVGGNKKKD